ncbi:hypothetical protein Areg01_61910 [Actinoplanes regularis]|nr:hypothetical protein Areg01_61910 [Actinoplanes regularis]
MVRPKPATRARMVSTVISAAAPATFAAVVAGLFAVRPFATPEAPGWITFGVAGGAGVAFGVAGVAFGVAGGAGVAFGVAGGAGVAFGVAGVAFRVPGGAGVAFGVAGGAFGVAGGAFGVVGGAGVADAAPESSVEVTPACGRSRRGTAATACPG